MKTTVLFKTIAQKNLLLLAVGILIALAGKAQTYNTIADGNWNSASTWAGGVIPSATIGTGKVVNVKHDVTFNLNSDISITGTLNILADTLRFPATYVKSIKVGVNGLLNVNGGGIIQPTASASNIEVDRGRIVFTNSKVTVSRSFLSTKGASRTIVSSKLYIGQKYDLDGGGPTQSIDTIKGSLVETNLTQSGDFFLHSNTTFRVYNAIIRVNGANKFENDGNINVLPGAYSNYGFDQLKVGGVLQNDGSWNARIDAACIGGNIQGSQLSGIDFTRAQDCGIIPAMGNAPELVFKNPVLKSGQPNKQNAVYRFANVVPGIDGEVKLKKFSRNDILMQDIDLASMGWANAFQPQFGLPGLVQPNQNWYVDFELKFYQAGTNTLVTLPKVDMTALDVDGDGLSVSEYAVFQNPSNVIYSTISYLAEQPAGAGSQTFTCPIDGLVSPLLTCVACGGDGKSGTWNLTNCGVCNATGLLFTLCNHGYDGTNGTILQGPVENFINIDTAATQVMATYQYTDVNFIAFRYGGRSGTQASNGAGVRLNSLWFRQFNMAPPGVLPVKLTNFAATLNKKDVNLGWTGFEENFSHYILQRSTDGKEYKDIAIVFSTDNSGRATSYTYKDANVSSATGSIFYRLKMVDKLADGGKYSEVRTIRLGKEQEAAQLITYPNPVKDGLKVTLPNAWQGKAAMIEVYTANGVKIKATQLGSASQTETISLGSLSKGFYLVKVTCNGETAQQRIIKD